MEEQTIYVRNPQGDILAVYEYSSPPMVLGYYIPPVYPKEEHRYGADRLERIKRRVQAAGPARIMGIVYTSAGEDQPQVATFFYGDR